VNPQINWSKVLQELNKLADVDKIKREVKKVGIELRKFDINAHLSPSAKARLKNVEQSYQKLSRSIHKTQRQVDREFNRVLRNLKKHRSQAEKSLLTFKKTANSHKKKLEKVSMDLKKRVMKRAGVQSPMKKTTGKKATNRKAKA